MEMNEERFTIFYGGICSQWYRSNFWFAGVKYRCAEQAMMHHKALAFHDYQAAKNIMISKYPDEQKALGRKVVGYDDEVWCTFARSLVYEINLCKFRQDSVIAKELCESTGTTLVEASPTDKRWGIGMDENSPRCHDRSKWDGENWLGECLTKVRDQILYESS